MSDCHRTRHWHGLDIVDLLLRRAHILVLKQVRTNRAPELQSKWLSQHHAIFGEPNAVNSTQQTKFISKSGLEMSGIQS